MEGPRHRQRHHQHKAVSQTGEEMKKSEDQSTGICFIRSADKSQLRAILQVMSRWPSGENSDSHPQTHPFLRELTRPQPSPPDRQSPVVFLQMISIGVGA